MQSYQPMQSHVLLYANLIVITILAVLRGTNPFNYDVEADMKNAEDVNDYRGFMNVLFATCGFSIVISGFNVICSHEYSRIIDQEVIVR